MEGPSRRGDEVASPHNGAFPAHDRERPLSLDHKTQKLMQRAGALALSLQA
jgi:hypothetical protein